MLTFVDAIQNVININIKSFLRLTIVNITNKNVTFDTGHSLQIPDEIYQICILDAARILRPYNNKTKPY